MIPHRRWGAIVVAVALAAILFVTLRPADGPTPPLRLCLLCGSAGTVDFTLNLVMFTPLGAGLALLGYRMRTATALSFLVSLCIEALQLWVIPGRDPTLGDLVANTLGGALGTFAPVALPALLLPAPPVSRKLLALGVSSWVALAFGTVWAFRPHVPELPLWGQWTPRRAGQDIFGGTLISVAVSDSALPRGPLASPDVWRERLLTRGIQMTVEAEIRQMTFRVAPIAAIYDLQRQMIVELRQQRRDVSFGHRMNADRIRLGSPSIVVRSILEYGPVVLHGARVEGALVAGPIGGEMRILHLSPSLGWVMLWPFGTRVDPGVPLRSLLWVGGILMVIGYWGGRAGVARWALPAGALAIAGGLAGAPFAFGDPAAPALEWSAGIIGFSAGVALGVFSHAAERRLRSGPRTSARTR